MPGLSNIYIIGGGLAGTFTALRLVQHGGACVLVHHRQPHAASAVAAGLFNIATGQRAVLSWRALQLLGALYDFFETPLFAPLKQHLHTAPIYRPFASVHLCNEWTARSADAELQGLVSVSTVPWHAHELEDPLGGLTVYRCGWLDVPAFLNDAHAMLEQSALCTIVKEKLDYATIDTTRQTITLAERTHAYEHLIFAEGIGVNQNPLRPFRTLQPLKGELLVVKLEGISSLDRIIIGGVYVIPRADGLFIIGSTYDKQFTTPEPTPEGRFHILNRLQKLFPAARIRVVQHLSGIRPTTPDRRPIVGKHPFIPNLWHFNGLGTKGVLQAPYFSSILTQNLLGLAGQLPPEVALTRSCLQPGS